jgi:rhodanese-related sulfurtransferase
MREIDNRELARMLGRGDAVYLIDVREPWEHQLAALPGSVLVPLGELEARAATLDPPPGVPVVTYCHHGVRSLAAASVLARAGFTDVRSLAGGLDAWSREIDHTVPRY